jgi:GNAT superfamily N-acetyltransferase
VTTGYLPIPAREATPADLDAIVAALTTAFFDDPLWGPAYPDPGRRAVQAATLWRFLVASALRYPWTFVSEGAEAAAVWIPPNGIELTHDEESHVEGLLVEATGEETASGILNLFGLFEAARPTEPHFYLSLLGVHDDHRGKGLGMSLLAENLERIDALGAPAYLESSNPGNNARYEKAGFVAHGEIVVPATGHVMTTMWRSAR